MPRTTIKADGGLIARMALTMFLLGAVYAALIAVLISAGVGITIVVGVLAVMLLAQFFTSDKLALRAMNAREVSRDEMPEFHGMIERLAVAADVAKPKVAISEMSLPNAFAMGRSRKKATVCATTGIMQLLTPTELEAVMAHEMTHVRNRDVAIMTIASFFAAIAAYIVQFGFLFSGGDDDEGPGALVLVLVSLVVYLVSFVLMQALSRYREFGADRGAAILTGHPRSLIDALRKLSAGVGHTPPHVQAATSEMNAFFIFPAGFRRSIGSLFATHPPMEKRIAALERIEREMTGLGG